MMLGDALVAGVPLIALLIAIGFVAGAFGTLVGIGGAVILTPALLVLFPQADTRVIVSISMGIVFLNALSGTFSYANQKRIDYRNGFYFAAASVPGILVGIWVLRFVDQRLFMVLFGFVMLVFSAILLVRPSVKVARGDSVIAGYPERDGGAKSGEKGFSRALGIILCFFIGFISGLLGIGGGILHIPMMLYVLSLPIHVATATSTFILVFTGFAGMMTHLSAGAYEQSWLVVLWLALGVIPGAQIGARISPKIKGTWLLRLLVVVLVAVGVRLILVGMFNG